MGFGERALASCVRAMRLGVISERHVRDVLRCGEPLDVSEIVPFLRSEDIMVRQMAAKILGSSEHTQSLLDAALVETERSVLLELLRQLGSRKRGLDGLIGLFLNSDPVVKDSTIDMFRRAGSIDSLFPLIFDEDDVLAQRIKRYLDEQEQGTKDTGS